MNEALPATDGASKRWRGAFSIISTAAIYYLLGACLVVGGVAAGVGFMEPCREHPKSRAGGMVDALGNWDGQWYAEIVAHGYSYDPRRESSVTLLPALPLVARGIVAVSGLRAEWALLIAAHLFLLASLAVMATYLRERLPRDEQSVIDDMLLVATLFPTTFYFRMAYSESMFLFLTLMVFYGVQRGWQPIWVALIVGVATATRPVGVALLLPLAVYLWQRSASRSWFFAQAVMLLPVACGGLLAYIGYQAWAFGEPLAFVQTQTHWSRTVHHHFWLERAVRLLTLEPIRAVYDSSSSCYWAHRPPRDAPWLNMMFANPLYFLFAGASLGLGAWKRWLNGNEFGLGALLLLIPYVLQGDRMCMASQARYASVVFPVYIVWGHVIHRLGWPAAAAILATSGAFLAAYSAMFACWYWYY